MGVRVRGLQATQSLGRVDDGLRAIEDHLADLAREVDTLQGKWNGEAREAFARAMRDAHASLGRLRALAGGATSEAGATIGAFQQLDRRRQSAWPV